MNVPTSPRARRSQAAIATVTLMTVAFVGLWTASAQARSTYLSDFNQRYNTSGSRLDTCGLCHRGSPSATNLNPFATDFVANGRDYQAIESKDSDGDEATNIEEIQALSFPGDPADTPGGQPTPTPTPSSGPIPGDIPLLKDVLRNATDGLPIVGATFGGKRGGFVPAPYADQLGESLETATKGTTESCTKCHPEKANSNHYFNVSPNGTADCWLCHSKHILCSTCHRVGTGESVGHVAAERVTAFTGQDASPVTNEVDAFIAENAPEINYLIADGGLLLKDMPGDVSGVMGVLLPILEGSGNPPRLQKTIYRIDNTVHDPRLYKRVNDAAPK